MNTINSEGHVLNRDELQIEVGRFVEHRASIYKIAEMLDFSSVMGVEVESGRGAVLAIAELTVVGKPGPEEAFAHYDIEDIADEGWAQAQRRYAAIAPLLQKDLHVKGAVEARAAETGNSVATLYRWISRYTESGGFLALLPGKRGWSKGNARITDDVKDIIDNCINSTYLTDERNSKKDTYKAVCKACELRGIKPPNLSTVHMRINALPQKLVLKARGYSELASNLYDARPGRFSSDYTLQRIQIDHTRADVFVVDDEHRWSIGRPWVSMAIDIHTRMIVGYYLSLDAPSAVSVAMCLTHAILPKERWLEHHGVEGTWPVWGKPRFVHTDNGMDFKTQHLIQAMEMHGIHKEFRPVKRPHWGGHIERLMGENARIFSKLKGASGNKPDAKGDRVPEKEATMSMEALEKWLICKIIKYNNEYHSSIHMPPVKKWNDSFFGSKSGGALRAMPPRPVDPWTLQLDFMPKSERHVHPYGVEWDAIYYGEILNPWINHSDPVTGKKTKLIFRRDTRDVTCIWFYEPIQKKYFRIGIAHKEFFGATVSEYVAAKRKVKKLGFSSVDSRAIATQLRQTDEIEQQEAEKTKKALLKQQKQAAHKSLTTPAKVFAGDKAPPTKSSVVVLADADSWGEDDVGLYGRNV